MKATQTNAERLGMNEPSVPKLGTSEYEPKAFDFAAVIYHVVQLLPVPQVAPASGPRASEQAAPAVVRDETSRPKPEPTGASETVAAGPLAAPRHLEGASPNIDPALQSAVELVLNAIDALAHASPQPGESAARSSTPVIPTGETSDIVIVRDASTVPPIVAEPIGSQGSGAKLWVTHPELGLVHMELHLQGDALTLRFTAAKDGTAETLRARATALRSHLNARGFTLQHFHVSTEPALSAGFGHGYAIASLMKHVRSNNSSLSRSVHDTAATYTSKARSRRWRWAFDTEA